MYYYGFDITYLYMVLPAIILSMWAQSKVKGTFAKYSKIKNRRGITGEQAARFILDRNDLRDVRIEKVAGNLSDHYDPRTKVVRLSEGVYSSSSLAAVGVAAHEVGHAIQHSHAYFPLVVRNAIIPVTRIASSFAFPLILLGMFLNYRELIPIGIACFGAAVLFQLITLPVEYNASGRAMAILDETGLLGSDELPGTRKVLSAAALTYVAAMLVALMQMLRLMFLFGGRGRD